MTAAEKSEAQTQKRTRPVRAKKTDAAATKQAPGKSIPPKVARKPEWKSLSDAELAAHLLATPTLADKAWADRASGATRNEGEARDAFIRRVFEIAGE